MRQFTTPTHEIVVEGIDLTGCDVHVTYTQGKYVRDVTVEPEFDGTDTHLYVPWGQAESGQFKVGAASVQVNWIYEDGNRNATNDFTFKITKNLLARVISYGG